MGRKKKRPRVPWTHELPAVPREEQARRIALGNAVMARVDAAGLGRRDRIPRELVEEGVAEVFGEWTDEARRATAALFGRWALPGA